MSSGLDPRRIRTRLISLVVSASSAFRSHAQPFALGEFVQATPNRG
jgi:hypothetical protein